MQEQEKHKSTIDKKAIPHGNAFEGIHSLEEKCEFLIQVLYYVGRSKKDRKMTWRSFCSPP